MGKKSDKKELLVQFEQEHLKLKKQYETLKTEKNELLAISSNSDSATSIAGLETFLVRIGPGEIIQYVNSAFTKHFSIDKEGLIGKPISVLHKIVSPEILAAKDELIESEENVSEGIAANKTPGVKSMQIKNSKGDVYDIKNTFSDGVQDIVIQDITNEHQLNSYISKYTPSDLTKLSEEDLKTFKYPERRFMSVSFTDLRGFTALSENMAPEEVRTTMNSYLEEVIQAIDSNGATVDKIVGDEVMALYGAPRYYNDHALRAIKTACEQIFNLKALQTTFSRIGKHMPECGIGITSGEMVIGNIGSSTRQDYTVLGAAVNLGSQLCSAAKGGEILITEATMNAALESIPDDWQIIKVKSKKGSKLNELGKNSVGFVALPKELIGKVIKIGPNVKNDQKNAEYKFTYKYLFGSKGNEAAMPILTVSSPKNRSSLTLSQDTVEQDEQERIFGKFRLLKMIGRGGMGEVWKAKDSFGNIVAIKMLLAGEGASEGSLKRFRREAEIMSKLQHRNVCRINEVGIIDKITFISMEYIDGISLSELLKSTEHNITNEHTFFDEDYDLPSLLSDIEQTQVESERSRNSEEEENGEASEVSAPDKSFLILPKSETLSIMIKIAQGMQHAHENGILHRDLKPANIMMRNDGEPVVMDFGLAKIDQQQVEEGMSLSISGQIVGTIEYMSPEQAQSAKHVGEQTDVYSLGAILFQMICGKRHFKSSGNILSDANKLEHYEPPKPSDFHKNIDSDLDVITTKCLRPDIADRYISVQAFQDELEHYQKGEAISARSVSSRELAWKWCKRNKVLSITLLSTLFIIVFGTLISFYNINLKKNEALKEKDIAQQESKKATVAQKLAQTNFQNLKKTAPDFIAYAKILISEHRFKDALAKIDIALSLAPKVSEYWKLKGDMHQSLMESTESHIAYKQVIELEPTHPEVRESLKLSANLISAINVNNTFSANTRMDIFNLMKKQNRLPEVLNFTQYLDNKNQHLLQVATDKLKNSPFADIARKMKVTEDGYLSYSQIVVPKEIKNINVFKGLPMKSLWLGGSEINDISALKGMPLTHLILGRAKVLDFSVLKSLKLKSLRIPQTQFSDLSLLEGMPINSLNIIDCKNIRDFSILETLPLTHLSLNIPVEKLSILKDLSLKELRLNTFNFKDLTFLKSMPLEILEIKNNTISKPQILDLSALKGKPLKKLRINNCIITNISVLEGMPLKELYLSHCLVKDISILKGMPLLYFSLPAYVQDISALKGMPLTYLKILDITKLTGDWRAVINSLKSLKEINVSWKPFTVKQFWEKYGRK